MKKNLTIILILLSFGVFSQSNVSYVSTNKDTLILVNDDLGKLIAQTWTEYSDIKKPKIIFASAQYITMRNTLIKNEEQ